MRSKLRIGMATVAVLTVGLTAQAFAVTAPYAAFTGLPGDPLLSDFSTGSYGAPGGSWTVNGSTLKHAFTAPGIDVTSQAVQTADVAGQNFTVSTQMRFVTEVTPGSGWTGGLAVLASGAPQGLWDGSSWYTAGISYTAAGAASLDILKNGDYGVSIADSAPLSVIAAGSTFTLTISGAYDGTGGLTLTAALAGDQTQTVVSDLQASPLSGSYFGLREVGYYGTEAEIDYSNFQIVGVPEPTSLAFLAVGAMGLMSRRRK